MTKRKDLIERGADFVHRGAQRSGWDKDFSSTTDYVLTGFSKPKTVEQELREINKLCLNRCTILAEGKRVWFSINPNEKTAVTNGRYVRVGTAVLDEPEKSFSQKADIMVGLTTHEMAHIRYSKFGSPVRSRLHHSVMNVIEDERIEHLLTDKFPGYAQNLADVKKYMLDERYLVDKAIESKVIGFREMSEKEEIAMEIFDIFFKLVRYPVYIDEKVYDKHKEYIDKIREILTPYPMTVAAVEDTSSKVYDVILDAMKKAVDPPKPPPVKVKVKVKSKGGGGGGKSEEEEEGEGEGKEESKSGKPKAAKKGEKGKEKEEEGEEKGESGPPKEDKEEPKASAGGEEEEEESKEEGSPSAKEGEEESEEEAEDPEDPAEAAARIKAAEELAKLLETIEEDISEMMTAFQSDNDPENKSVEDAKIAKDIIFSEEYSHDPEFDAHFRVGKPNKPRYNILAAGISADARRLANSLRTRTFNESKNLRGMRSGHLDDSKIIEAAHGIATVHTQRIEKESRTLNIVVLIDESGSMGRQGGEKVDNASKAAILIEKAFETFNAGQLFIYGFTSDHDNDHNCIFRYREPGLKVSGGLGDIRGRSNNRDGDCIRAVAKRVRTFSQEPMIFFVISDGQPAAYGYDGIRDTRHAVTYISKMKFFPIQIGIGSSITPTVQAQMFDEFVHYDSSKQMVDDLRKLILRKAHKIFGL